MNQITLLLFFFYSACSSAQHKPNAVDSINSQESLNKFIDRELIHSQRFYNYSGVKPVWNQKLDTVKVYFGGDKFYKRFIDSFPLDPCIRKDFNGDGLTDLAVECDGGHFVFYFFSKNDGSFNIRQIFPNGSFFEGRIFLKDINLDKLSGICLITVAFYSEGASKIGNDTLIYNYDYLMPSNKNVKKGKYKAIKIYTTPCFGHCPVYSLEIDNKGCLTYFEGGEWGLEGADSVVYKYKLTPDSFAELKYILDYLGPKKLHKSYRISSTDYSSITLEIKYSGLRKVKIWDYGKCGTYGLIAFYDYIENLRRNVKWERVSNH